MTSSHFRQAVKARTAGHRRVKKITWTTALAATAATATAAVVGAQTSHAAAATTTHTSTSTGTSSSPTAKKACLRLDLGQVLVRLVVLGFVLKQLVVHRHFLVLRRLVGSGSGSGTTTSGGS